MVFFMASSSLCLCDACGHAVSACSCRAPGGRSPYIIVYYTLFPPVLQEKPSVLGPTLQKRSETAGWFAARHPSGKLRAPDHAAILFMQPYAPGINPAEPIGKGLRASDFCNETLASRKKGVDRLRETINRLAVETVIRIAGRNDPERPSAKLRTRSLGNGISSISEGMQPASCRLREA